MTFSEMFKKRKRETPEKSIKNLQTDYQGTAIKKKQSISMITSAYNEWIQEQSQDLGT